MTTTTNEEATMSSTGSTVSDAGTTVSDADVRPVATDLAADFEKRRAGRVDAGDLVGENLAALAAAGITPAAVTDAAVRRRVLRTVAGGCGATAFALAATFAATATATATATDTDTGTADAGSGSTPAGAGRAEAVLYHAAVQFGLAERAYAVAVDRVRHAGDLARQPGPQFAVARMRGSLDTMTALLDRQAARVVDAGAAGRDDGDDAGALAEACTAGLYLAGEAETVVSAGYDLVAADPDGAARIGQIWHDLKATPAPVSGSLARELVGKAAFGIDPDETPRWV
ncbi:hypothetical protein [Micromonospora cathayae]|uniref:DUF4439 domain-containing protein n=1 Tax=Micromonospora cathayae TaxID=3028804 RepID=A0ABY7ZQ80_9ACTN|nr:hypothetical protein [Micromonospora sp. HUAS 3]WDZ84663.1 hypothetical protein PVK37_30250 [Micromonospora sp. HUAS 3]